MKNCHGELKNKIIQNMGLEIYEKVEAESFNDGSLNVPNEKVEFNIKSMNLDVIYPYSL